MWAMIVKEFRQLRRDRRTLAMLIVLPVLLLIIFGYAARFEVTNIPTVIVGPGAKLVSARLPAPFRVVEVNPTGTTAWAQSRLRDSDATVAVVAEPGSITIYMDGTQLFAVQSALRALGGIEQGTGGGGVRSGLPPGLPAGLHIQARILYNPGLSTPWIMIPGLSGLILLFVGTLVTSLGIVRERQAGTIEQLAVMPLRPWDVIFGKIVPYLVLGSIDLVAIVLVGKALFNIPFVGDAGTLALGALLFLLVTLGMGVLVSTVSQNQGQAIQLAIMFVVPQILLSGLIFPISSMAAGVSWIAYVLPLSYFIEISRGVMLKGTPITALWEPLVLLSVLAVVVLGLAVMRFRRDLAPSTKRSTESAGPPVEPGPGTVDVPAR